MRKKRGQGNIITVVLIILIVLTAIILVWSVIKKTLSKGTEDIDSSIITASLTIEEPVYINYTANLTRFGVTRGTDEAIIDHLTISLVGIDGTGKISSRNFNVSAPTRLETKYYTLNFTGLTKLNKIRVYPISPNGKTGPLVEYIVRGSEQTSPPSWGNIINPDNLPPACDKGTWSDSPSCGTNGCAATERYQTRTVNPAGCDTSSWCNPDPSCTCSPGGWTNQGCGPAGGCDTGDMYQTRTVNPAGCNTTSQCVANASCMAVISVSGCQILGTSGAYYNVTNDIGPVLTGTCFQVATDNITLDGNGHKIVGDGVGYDYGVSATDRPVGKVVIKNLNISGFWGGVYLQNANNFTVKNNNIHDNNGSGISLSGTTATAFIASNVISNNSKSQTATYDGALQVFSSGFSNYVFNNTVINNRQVGISLGWNVADVFNKIENNTVSGNGAYGLFIRNSSQNTFTNNRFCNNNQSLSDLKCDSAPGNGGSNNHFTSIAQACSDGWPSLNPC
jgi:parallel beta-helix repeat protein